MNPLPQHVMDEIAAGKSVFLPLIRVFRGEEPVEALQPARDAYLARKANQKSPDGVTFKEVSMGGVPATVAEPVRAEGSLKTVLYLHGGGYVSGGSAGSFAIMGRLALGLNARIYAPDYRLAPQYPFPIPIDDSFVAYRWLLDQGIDTAKLALVGESAGAALVVTVMIRARNAAVALPAAGVCISPWVNLEHTGRSTYNRDGRDPIVSRAALELLAKAFLGHELPSHPEASPVYADVRGLPPILVQVGENEVMLSDAVRLASHLADNRIRVTLEVWPGMFHVWHHFAAILPEGKQAIANVCAFVGSIIGDVQDARAWQVAPPQGGDQAL